MRLGSGPRSNSTLVEAATVARKLESLFYVNYTPLNRGIRWWSKENSVVAGTSVTSDEL
jgi:hypothetical protein